MPGINTNTQRYENWAMEYDRYQHYFYDDHETDEDFYKSTAPSEDIWKKFELVPTPPMSPIRILEGGGGGNVYPSPGDKLEWVTQVLGQEEEQEGQYKIDTEEIFGNLSSIIIQDCMWSGFSASHQLEKVVSERLSGSTLTKLPLTLQAGTNQSNKPQFPHQDAPLLSTLATDCVDPAAVLTYPFSGSCKKQASSGSESRTDSSEDEEIDVVTVENKQNKSRLLSARKPVTITVHADPHDPCMKRFHISIHQQQHNYAAPSPDGYPDTDPPRKRARQEPAHPQHHPAGSPSASPEKKPSPAPVMEPSSPLPQVHSPKSQPSSPQSSDCEDTDKRKTHNYLERKRRNDLRSRFLALRDEIPGLVDCPKTPKVVILTRAREYLRQLHANDKHKAQERKQLKSRQLQLLRKLADLKRS
ncbi:protein L-Myc-1b [Anguilla anguilla]|uniref:protein L-Myc-1b n=1 Tax=Anguilla anguilla TaxID=7936 RepID=UPI0015AC6CEE|nr:protein L-Myc-1b [Anguilla anguilla]XP_035286773.1 protein L-Myc-1b [Anguilla anguilla]XP_035286774.1 protein L-Myc-1b [Anguilla anguilla]